MKFELVTPQKLFASLQASHVRAPGVEGDFGVLEGHMPFISNLRDGLIEVETKKGLIKFDIKGGFAEVTANSVTVLAQSAKQH